MAIEFNVLTGGISNYLYEIPMLNSAFSNVLYTSIILSILLMIILLFIYPCSNSRGSRGSKSESKTNVFIKLFLYLVLVNTGILTIHHSMVSTKYKEKLANSTNEAFINNITQRGGNVVYSDENIRVVPDLSEQERIDDSEVGIISSGYSESNARQNVHDTTNTSEMLDKIENSVGI